MAHPSTFPAEQWMSRWCGVAGLLNLADTYACPISIDELNGLLTEKDDGPLITSSKLSYGSTNGSSELRQSVAELCSGQETQLTEDDVVITQGGISANFLVLYALLGPTDHAICVYPVYTQLYSVPETFGAQVSFWRLKEENGFIPDVQDLHSLFRRNTKMIILNNPNNPTGTVIPERVLRDIVEIAKARGVIVFSDEVYRPLFHEPDSAPPPITSFGYKRTLATGSMSKSLSLPGIRIGWVTSPDRALIAACSRRRDFTTICVSQVDDQIATYALSAAVRPALLRRNIDQARHNRRLVEAFVARHADRCRWVRPSGGTMAFIQFRGAVGGAPVDDEAFCTDLVDKYKVLLIPGSHSFGWGEDFAGYVRLAYVCDTAVVEAALSRLSQYLEEHP
ncbi:Pyridoxal phosphate-dependent transferase, major domain protein [Cordyceps fumosorosea ARSEF 2679]|uniref:Pyridoxal phosphate-dependent transferase, major domain protein n=1 Tax=Cordyceps fumosorosea (strain ARSEF 2679) TaxID=1081104 RepID=A0A162JT87_CORFA|nr:Pyridoxal phosphate-dependent transferase, major domain protein [Cordyceps fumosorosea ARSEF 2679]OAA73432.1 Pyridoxal phosphate-dependent transferase, major domain protein [Cordyceps fumosorosea ARSEF 2679]